MRLCSLLLLALLITPVLRAQSSDEERVRAAVLDYVEAIYQIEPDRISESVHLEMAKRGFWRQSPDDAYSESTMTYDQLVRIAETWNRNGRVDPETAVKDVIIYEILDKTASVKLIADWGIDYMHLAKYDDTWKIVNVLWQSHPEE